MPGGTDGETGGGSATPATLSLGAVSFGHTHTLAGNVGVGQALAGNFGSVGVLAALAGNVQTGQALSGAFVCVHRLASTLTRTYVKINAALVVQQPGIPAFVLLGRTDAKAVSLLDTDTEGVTVYGLVYKTRVIQTDLPYHLRSTVGNQEVRTSRKRVTRLVVFGSGTLLAGSSLTVHCDGVTETYALPQTLPSDVKGQGILIYQELSAAMTGRVLWAEFTLNGTGIVITDTLAEINFVG